MGLPVAQRAARPARIGGTCRARVSPSSYMFPNMYWPLIGGFIAFLLLAIFLGWVMDRGGDASHDGHDGH
jgi:hypothetical protein